MRRSVEGEYATAFGCGICGCGNVYRRQSRRSQLLNERYGCELERALRRERERERERRA